MEFEWDPAKEAANVAKHGISFIAAARVLASGTTFEFESGRGAEPRRVAIGMHTETRKIVAVVYTMREGRYRIISARRARANEEAEYRKEVTRRAPEGQGEDDGPDDER
jgi:hypothetical protein